MPSHTNLQEIGNKAYFGSEDCKQENLQIGQIEVIIDFFGSYLMPRAFDKNIFLNDQINAVDFHYYFHVDCQQRKIVASSCLFGILPLYYSQSKDITYISNRVGLIVKNIGKTWKFNEKFLVEQALFNYSFQDETIYAGVKLLPANCILTLANGLSIEKYFSIADHYCSEPKSVKASIEPLRDLFIADSKKYFTSEKSTISFTSGYDGRTLLACSMFHGKVFDTYSFGAQRNEDISIPLATAQKLGIPFKAILLDEEYAEKDFYPTGVELMELTDGNNNFLQVHHLYAAKLLAKNHNCLLNGMFGSELFRALHISGQVTSKELVSIFANDAVENIVNLLKNSPKLKCFDESMITGALDNVITNVAEYKTGIEKSGLTKNQQFYTFIFEDAFRKYFGYIIAPQMKYINVRSPFLNFSFIKELFKSELAGVNNEFFVHNPLRRFKGQLLYSWIIEKTEEKLLSEKIAKGYAPKDLLRLSGAMKIGYQYLKKKVICKFQHLDLNNLMIVSGLEKSKALITINHPFPLYNINSLNSSKISELDVPERDSLGRFLSMVGFLNNKLGY